MEIPSKVTIFNNVIEIKGKPGTLVAVNDLGFYEITMEFKERTHRVLLPIGQTALIFNEAVQEIPGFEVER